MVRSRFPAIPVHIDKINAASGIGPAACHALNRRPRDVESRENRARHGRWVKLVQHGLDAVYRVDFVAMNATDQSNAFARLLPLHHDDGMYQC